CGRALRGYAAAKSTTRKEGDEEVAASGRLAIDPAFRHRGKLLVGRLFLIEVLLPQGGAIVAAEVLGPCDQTAVAGDLVMRHRRGGSDEPPLQLGLVRRLARDVFRFFDDPIDRRATRLAVPCRAA